MALLSTSLIHALVVAEDTKTSKDTPLLSQESIGSNTAQANIYDIELSFQERWHKLTTDAQLHYQEELPNLKQQLTQIPKTQPKHYAYAALTVTALALTLELNGEAEQQLDAIEELITQLNHPAFNAYYFYEKARLKFNTAEYAAATQLNNQALRIYQTLNAPVKTAEVWLLKGQIEYHKENYDEALTYYLKAYQQFKDLKRRTLLSTTVASIAQLYTKTGEHAKAIEYYQESLTLIDNERQTFYASVIYFNLGVAHQRLEQYSQSESWFRKALALSNQLNDDIGKAYVWRELGQIAALKNEHAQAIDYFEQSFQIISANNDRRMMVSITIVLAESYSAQGKHLVAKHKIEEALKLAREIKVEEAVIKALKTASEIYAASDDYIRAYQYQKQYNEQLVGKHQRERQRSLDEMKVKFDTEKKEAEYLLLQKDNDLKQLEIDKQETQKNLLWAVIAMALITTLAAVVIVSIQARSRRRFKAMALTDELTGAPNRRHILEYARRQLELAEDSGNKLAIGLIDLDRFKSINDQYGHDIGDKVLQHFYSRLSQTLRNLDRLGRFGGEEWLLVMPGIDKQQIDTVYQRLQEALSNFHVEGLPDIHRITFSLGVAYFSPNKSLETLIKESDVAVYYAKEAGRNCWRD